MENIKEQKRNNSKFIMSCDGLIVYKPDTPLTIRFNREETNKLLEDRVDYSKYDNHCEVAHLEISSKCNMHCSYCYVGKKDKKDLTTKQWCDIINNLANAGIFQVSFGGGEPTLRTDLFELAKEVQENGMNLAMTTNGVSLIRLDGNKLKKYFKQINVSWHGNAEIFEEALMFLQDHEIPRGINYTYSRSYAWHNGMVKYLAKEYDAELLYLVYKPVIKDKKNQIKASDVYKVAKISSDEGIRTAVDGPCVDICLAKKKFIDVDCGGNVLPCSFIRKPIGNLLEKDFKEIWKHRGQQEECPYVKIGKGKI